MYKEFKISDLLSYNKKLCEYFKNFKYIVYRIHSDKISMSYIGITRSMINRLYNKKFGHITNLLNLSNSNDLYRFMNDIGPENFYLSIEKECSDLLDLSLSEVDMIEKYDSFKNGFNKTRGGFIKCVLASNGSDTIISNINEIPLGFKIIGIPKYDRPDLKGRILVNNGLLVRRIRPSQLDEYLLNGYEVGSGGLMDHMSGKIFVYITDETNRILINKNDYPMYESLGYKRGRVNKGSLKGKIRITNGIDNLVIHKDEDIPEGFYRGVAPSNNRKGNSGRKWINNGSIDKAVLTSEVDSYLDLGWKLGRLSSGKRGKISMIKEGKAIFIPESMRSEHELNGYTKGSSINSGKNKGKIFITNGVCNKMILKSELPKYKESDFYVGITRKPKSKK